MLGGKHMVKKTNLADLVRSMTGKNVIDNQGRLYLQRKVEGNLISIHYNVNQVGGADKFRIFVGNVHMFSAYDCSRCGVVEGFPEHKAVTQELLPQGTSATLHYCKRCKEYLGTERF